MPMRVTNADTLRLHSPSTLGGRGTKINPPQVRRAPNPRRRAQLDGARHVARTTELAHEHLVSRGEREVPDQLRVVDLREPPKLLQLLIGERG